MASAKADDQQAVRGCQGAGSALYICIPSTAEKEEVGLPRVQGQPRPHSEFQTSLGYMTSFSHKQTNKQKQWYLD